MTIDPDECRRLLAAVVVGRVAWVSHAAGLQVLPVNFALADGRIVFTVAEESVLSELSQPVDVAFQADDLDPATATGWSVLVKGRTVAFDGDPGSLRGLPWAPGPREVAVAIEPVSFSGRTVSADER